MVKVYSVVLVVGLVALFAWIISATTSDSSAGPDRRFGVNGRRLVAGLVGFGMVGMSAEYSPRDLSWQVALVLAVLGAGIASWYAGHMARSETA